MRAGPRALGVADARDLPQDDLYPTVAAYRFPQSPRGGTSSLRTRGRWRPVGVAGATAADLATLGALVRRLDTPQRDD